MFHIYTQDSYQEPLTHTITAECQEHDLPVPLLVIKIRSRQVKEGVHVQVNINLIIQMNKLVNLSGQL